MSTRVQAERHRPSMRNVAPISTNILYRSMYLATEPPLSGKPPAITLTYGFGCGAGETASSASQGPLAATPSATTAPAHRMETSPARGYNFTIRQDVVQS